MTYPTVELTDRVTVHFTARGVSYKIGLLDEPEVDLDPTLLVFREDEEEAIFTMHLDPGADCHDGHGIAPPVPEAEEEDCDCCSHPHVEKDDDGLDGRWFVCTSCNQIVELSDPDEDGKSYWEVMS